MPPFNLSMFTIIGFVESRRIFLLFYWRSISNQCFIVACLPTHNRSDWGGAPIKFLQNIIADENYDLSILYIDSFLSSSNNFKSAATTEIVKKNVYHFKLTFRSRRTDIFSLKENYCS